MNFAQKLDRGWTSSGSRLCVGLDPILERMPAAIAAQPRPVLAFNRHIVDLIGDLACAFKPQFAHHAAVAAEQDLADTIAYIRRRRPHALVILDAKRGDIGSTAQMYAREAFDRHDADAVTVNPFMGDEAVLPFLERPDRGALVLCRTTNPDARRFQYARVGDEAVFEAIARRAEHVWNARGNVMLVVGATATEDMATIRRLAPSVAFLVPGFGEQGGSADAVLKAGLRADGQGLVVSASRSLLYAGSDADIRRAAQEAHRELAGASAEPSMAARIAR